MKNWLKGIAVGVLALGLAACGGSADEKPGTDPEKKSELTLQEVFDKAQEASDKQTSMHAKMTVQQKIEAAGESMDIDSNIEMDMIIEPLAMHQVMEMDLGEEGSMTMETYLTEDGFLMKDPESGGWAKMPAELFDEMIGSLTKGADPTLDLASMEKFVEDFKFEQNDSQYILKLNATGDQFMELVEEQLGSMGMFDELGEEGAEILEGMKINALEYEIFLDKETFNTTSFNMIMDMEISAEGETMKMSQNIKADISKINEIKEITVPQEVLDAVVEQ